MTHRFYCPTLPTTGAATLEDTEAHHLSHVLRQQVGDLVELFNGAGLVGQCRIQGIGKRSVSLEVISSRLAAHDGTRLILATAVPKGDRFDWLIEKATELGVSQLIPLTTQRSVVDPRASKLDKLRQTVIAACKQCGRNDLMQISHVTSWSDFVKDIHSEIPLLIAHPAGESLNSVLSSVDNQLGSIFIAIGPEGGFTTEEIQLAQDAGARAISLGTNILRIETAAIAIAACLLLR